MIEEAIRSIGGAHAGLGALIGVGAACRLYAGQAPQNAALPYVVFEKGAWRPISAIFVDTAWGYSEVTFTSHAATLRDAKLVNLQVRAAFLRYQGTVGSVQIDAVGTLATGEGEDDYDYDLDHHLVDQGIEFFHTE